MNAEDEGVENEVIYTEWRGYRLQNLPTINYNDGRANGRSMGYNNLIFGSRALHNVAKTYANVVNYIATFVEPTPQTNIITNETILTQ